MATHAWCIALGLGPAVVEGSDRAGRRVQIEVGGDWFPLLASIRIKAVAGYAPGVCRGGRLGGHLAGRYRSGCLRLE